MMDTSRSDLIELVVVGAHMSGMTLNHELSVLGGAFHRTAQTTDDYRLYALSGGPPKRPGLLRIADGQGQRINAEVWVLPPAGFGIFVASVSAPLSIGTVRLADASSPKGFLVEPEGIVGAADITDLGGWRSYMTSLVPMPD